MILIYDEFADFLVACKDFLTTKVQQLLVAAMGHAARAREAPYLNPGADSALSNGCIFDYQRTVCGDAECV